MTKRELADKISKKLKGELDTLRCEEIINIFTDIIMDTVAEGDTVFLRGFGRFTSKVRKAKRAQNITQRKTIEIPEKTIPHFKPYPIFKEKVK